MEPLGQSPTRRSSRGKDPVKVPSLALEDRSPGQTKPVKPKGASQAHRFKIVGPGEGYKSGKGGREKGLLTARKAKKAGAVTFSSVSYRENTKEESGSRKNCPLANQNGGSRYGRGSKDSRGGGLRKKLVAKSLQKSKHTNEGSTKMRRRTQRGSEKKKRKRKVGTGEKCRKGLQCTTGLHDSPNPSNSNKLRVGKKAAREDRATVEDRGGKSGECARPRKVGGGWRRPGTRGGVAQGKDTTPDDKKPKGKHLGRPCGPLSAAPREKNEGFPLQKSALFKARERQERQMRGGKIPKLRGASKLQASVQRKKNNP